MIRFLRAIALLGVAAIVPPITATAQDDVSVYEDANEQLRDNLLRSDLQGNSERTKAAKVKLTNGITWLTDQIFGNVLKVASGDFSAQDSSFTAIVEGVEKRIAISFEDVQMAFNAAALNSLQELFQQQWESTRRMFKEQDERWQAIKDDVARHNTSQAALGQQQLTFDEEAEREQASATDFFRKLATQLASEQSDEDLEENWDSLNAEINAKKEEVERSLERKRAEMQKNAERLDEVQLELAERISEQNRASQEFNDHVQEALKPLEALNEQIEKKRDEVREWLPDFAKRVRKHSGLDEE